MNDDSVGVPNSRARSRKKGTAYLLASGPSEIGRRNRAGEALDRPRRGGNSPRGA